MLDLALKAGLPFIGIQTDDLVNLEQVLRHLSGKKPILAKAKSSVTQPTVLYYSMEESLIDPVLYERALQDDLQVVFVNTPPNSLVFDAGTMHPPEDLVGKFLDEAQVSRTLLPVLRGLSLKAVAELVRLTEAKYGNFLPHNVRSMRTQMGESIQGLYPQDTSYDFYQFPTELSKWLVVNKPYFLKSQHEKLVPRGILLQGPPGTGKTMAAKAIANELGVPLYRMDIGIMMDKYVGVSENRMARILQQVEKEQPCVLLVDEIEKSFSENEDSGVAARLLSQLLWWLSEHRSRVLTVLTANSLSVPPELYRAGRIDLVMTISKLSMAESKIFANKVLQSIAGTVPLAWQMEITKQLESQKSIDFSHAEVAELVYSAIKRNQWIL